MDKDKELDAKEIKRLLLRVYKRYSSGGITETKAAKEKDILMALLRVIETSEIEQRVERLETITGMEIR